MSSTGGLFQLVAVGAQDIYLTGSPHITYWRVVYRRHTNFAMESLEQQFNGQADFGRKISCQVSRSGDLVHKAYLQIDLPPLIPNANQTVAWTRNIGHVLLEDISLDVGGATITREYGIYYSIWNELTQTAEKGDGFDVAIGNVEQLTVLGPSITAATLHVPLLFFFCMNPGLALPLIALMYHEVKININFRPAVECYVTSDHQPLAQIPVIQNVTLYLDYIFLDQAERRMFSQMNHEYLIEQVQYSGGESFNSGSIQPRLNFSHPTKELIWVVQPDANVLAGRNRWVDFTDNGTGSNEYNGNDPMISAKIMLNTHDRISERPSMYFNITQPLNHHTRVPSTGIYVYSFALEPEKHQPSGSINFSRIEGVIIKANLSTGTSPVKFHCWARSYNIFRVAAGMAGVAYAN